MKEQFPAHMLRVYFGEDDQWQGRPLQTAILEKCREVGVVNAVAYRGVEGFGASTRVRRERTWSFSKDAPLTLSIVATEEQVQKLLPHLDRMVTEGLVSIARVEAIRYFRAGPDQ